MDCSVFIYRIVINVYLCFVKWRKMLGKNKHIVCYMYTFFLYLIDFFVGWKFMQLSFQQVNSELLFHASQLPRDLKTWNYLNYWCLRYYDRDVRAEEGLNRVISIHYCLWVWTRPLSGATFILINCFILILNRQPLK